MHKNHSKYKPEFAEQLPAMFDNGETVEEVCLKLGINQKIFDEWKSQYPDFNHASEMAELRAECFYEGLLFKAIIGKLKHKNLDDDALIELMRVRFPETYGL